MRYDDDLADGDHGCARAIAIAVERLLPILPVDRKGRLSQYASSFGNDSEATGITKVFVPHSGGPGVGAARWIIEKGSRARRGRHLGGRQCRIRRVATSGLETRETKEGLRRGKLKVAVGTQALAAKNVRFDDLVLVLIDEEQHFGAADNAKLSGLAKGVHTLWMSATPIPRTLAAGLAGFRDLSVIATPPVHRLPVVHPRQHRLQILNARTNQEALSVTPLLAQQCSGDGGVRRGSGSIAGVGAS
jgi:hypothetical protein